MINVHRLLLGLGFTCLVSFQVFAEVPVVDDSENFAILDEQQAVNPLPVNNTHPKYSLHDEEDIALAQDNRSDSSDNAALLDKLQGMQQELQELRGQLEVQAHALKLLQQQQLAFYKDLDMRLRNNPSTPTQSAQTTHPEQPTELSLSPSPTTTAATAEPQEKLVVPSTVINPSRTNPANEQISYLAAYDLVKNKRFDDALTAMQAFVAQYPQGGYTANAQYWLGELYMVKNDYPQAIEHFKIVLDQFPSSNKTAASTLKVGYALAALGKKEEAKLQLQQVVKKYPDTPTAQLATSKLESLGAS